MRQTPFDLEEDTDEEEELKPRVKYSVILKKEEYEDEEEEDPVPYVDLGPGYFFLQKE